MKKYFKQLLILLIMMFLPIIAYAETTYDVNFMDGTNILTTVTVNENEVVSEPTDASIVIKNNGDLIIDCWSIDENSCTTPYDFSAPVTNDLVLYAHWKTKYSVTSGANGIYNKDLSSSSELSFTVNANSDDYSLLEINGEAVPYINYELEGDSVFTISKTYLDTLDAGEYSIVFRYDDGIAQTKFTIEGASTSSINNNNTNIDQPVDPNQNNNNNNNNTNNNNNNNNNNETPNNNTNNNENNNNNNNNNDNTNNNGNNSNENTNNNANNNENTNNTNNSNDANTNTDNNTETNSNTNEATSGDTTNEEVNAAKVINPSTGDTIITYLMILGVSLISLITVYKKINN